RDAADERGRTDQLRGEQHAVFGGVLVRGACVGRADLRAPRFHINPSRVRGWVRGLLLAAVLLGAFAVRVVTSAKAELRAGDDYRAHGQLEPALVHYRRAARWYAPGSPYHVQALRKLGAIGADAEKAGDTDLALSA